MNVVNGIDPVRLAAVGVVLLVVAAAVTLTAVHGGQPRTAAETPLTAPASTAPPMADPSATASSSHAPTIAPRGDEGPPASAQDVADAEAVAAAFVGEWATSRYDELPEAAIARIRPYVTSSLAAQLRADLHHPSPAAQLEEITEAVVEHIHGQAITGTQITLVVVARQRTRTTEGDTVEHPSFTVALIPEGSRWRVHELVH